MVAGVTAATEWLCKCLSLCGHFVRRLNDELHGRCERFSARLCKHHLLRAISCCCCKPFLHIDFAATHLLVYTINAYSLALQHALPLSFD